MNHYQVLTEELMTKWLLLAVLAGGFSSAFANEDSTYIDQALREEQGAPGMDKNRLPAEEIFRRTGIVFKELGVQPEENFQPELDGFAYSTSPSQIAPMLKS